MTREYYIITRARGGWIVTRNGDLFSASMSSNAEKPIWVFTALKPLLRFLSARGFNSAECLKEQAADAVKITA